MVQFKGRRLIPIGIIKALIKDKSFIIIYNIYIIIINIYKSFNKSFYAVAVLLAYHSGHPIGDVHAS